MGKCECAVRLPAEPPLAATCLYTTHPMSSLFLPHSNRQLKLRIQILSFRFCLVPGIDFFPFLSCIKYFPFLSCRYRLFFVSVLYRIFSVSVLYRLFSVSVLYRLFSVSVLYRYRTFSVFVLYIDYFPFLSCTGINYRNICPTSVEDTGRGKTDSYVC